jgi:hypothetical protein
MSITCAVCCQHTLVPPRSRTHLSLAKDCPEPRSNIVGCGLGRQTDAMVGWNFEQGQVLEDVFALQENVTQAIVPAAAPQIGSTEELSASVLDHKFAGVFLRQNRSIDAMMSSADLVQRKGAGSALCCSRKDMMSARRAATPR